MMQSPLDNDTPPQHNNPMQTPPDARAGRSEFRRHLELRPYRSGSQPAVAGLGPRNPKGPDPFEGVGTYVLLFEDYQYRVQSSTKCECKEAQACP